MIFLQEFEEKFEYLFLESRKHGVFYDEYHLGSIVDDGNFVTINHLAHIVIEEIKMCGNGHNLSFESGSLGFSQRLARDDAPLDLFRSYEFPIVAREVAFRFFEIRTRTVSIVDFSVL